MKKKKYVMKKDESYYEDLSDEYSRRQMSDYSFKKRVDVEGKNITRLRRNKIIKAVLCVIGALFIMSVGYFIVATVRNVNSYHPPVTQTVTEQATTPSAVYSAKQNTTVEQ